MQTFDLEAADRTGRSLGRLWPAAQPILPTRRRLLTGALATASVLAAPAIVRAQTARKFVWEFGDGATQRNKSEADADWGACFSAAARSGALVEVPAGNYRFKSYTNGDTSSINNYDPNLKEWFGGRIDFACAPDARFIVDAGKFDGVAGTLLRFKNKKLATETGGGTLRFTGGFFDCSELKTFSGSGVGIMDIFQYNSPYIANVRGYGGNPPTTPPAGSVLSGPADSLLTTHNCTFERIHNLWGAGFFDCCLYLSGDNNGDVLDGIGERALVTGLVATRCGNGVAMKRDYVGAQIEDCSIWYCQNGIICGRADNNPTNHGKRARVFRGQISQIQGRPIVIYGMQPLVDDVYIGDYGLNLMDQRTPTGASSENRIAAIDLRGCTSGRVRNCTISTRTIGSDPRFGIALRTSEADGQVTSSCTIEGNDVFGPPTKIYVQQGNENNTIRNNT